MSEEELTWDDIQNEEECPECGYKAPVRQLKSMGMCERCHLEGKTKKDGETLNPENNILDKWKLSTPNNQNETVIG